MATCRKIQFGTLLNDSLTANRTMSLRQDTSQSSPLRMPEVLEIEWAHGTLMPPPSTMAALEKAADLLRSGRLVAIPTETVYGLAAVANDFDAVERIFVAKGRPSHNPLIVHVADIEGARVLSRRWSDRAEILATHFWPGPLTLVVDRNETLPLNVTAGGSTVAIRCPDQSLTRLLIEMVGQPLAAPSANRSTELSPTCAKHVVEGLGGLVDLILDAGPCQRGIESTVIDTTSDPPFILRPGPIGQSELSQALGVMVDIRLITDVMQPMIQRSPGTGLRHYAPRARVELTVNPSSRLAELLAMGFRVGWLTLSEPSHEQLGTITVLRMPEDPVEFAKVLYDRMHQADECGVDVLLVDRPPEFIEWIAIHDRLTRASFSDQTKGFENSSRTSHR